MQVLNVLDAATNRVEREGLSTQHVTRPLLLGSYNPDEGQVWCDAHDEWVCSTMREALTFLI